MPTDPSFGLETTLGFLSLTTSTKTEIKVTPDLVQYRPEAMPLVRLIEDAAPEHCAQLAVEQLRSGVPYRDFMAALFLAALRGPDTIAHSVYMIHAAHELSLDAPVQERLLPTFWALNNFKYWQNWHRDNPSRLRLPSGPLPAAENADASFEAALVNSEAEQAQRAIVAVARTQGLHAVMELLWQHGAKDNVDIGHNAIAVANCWRVLPTIGYQHLEPILCWLVPKLMGTGDAWYAPNRERVKQYGHQLPFNWAQDTGEAGLTHELLALMRELQTEAACQLAATRLATGQAHASAIWDAVHLHAGELMMRKADVSHPLHANTAANALRYAFRHSGNSDTRLLILLQAIAWQIQHRRRKLETDAEFQARDFNIEELSGSTIAEDAGTASEEILATLTAQPQDAARQAFTLAQQGHKAQFFKSAALRLVPAKATPDAHDIKFPVSIFEDYEAVSPQWRPHLLATSVYWLQGSDKDDSTMIQQAREAARTL